MQTYLIVVGFTIRQAFSLIMTMTEERLFTFCTNKMLQGKLHFSGLFGSNGIFSGKQTNQAQY